jgi:hypothetical protein
VRLAVDVVGDEGEGHRRGIDDRTALDDGQGPARAAARRGSATWNASAPAVTPTVPPKSYFRNHAQRMRYANLARSHLPSVLAS